MEDSPRLRLRRALRTLHEDGAYLLNFPRRRTRRGVRNAVWAGASVVALVLLDDEIRREVQERRTPSLDQWERRIEPMGKIRLTWSAALLVYGAGRAARHPPSAETGRALLESLLFTEAFNLTAKGVFGRKAPGPDADADDFFRFSSFFPSGHTARAFAFATVLAERHGTPAAWVAYPLAGLVGLSRMERDVHWASDVVAGALLGHVIARTVVRRRAARCHWGAPRLEVKPALMPGGRGVGAALRW